MGQVTSLAARRQFPSLKVGSVATLMFNQNSELELVSGIITHISNIGIVINDENVDGSVTKFKIPHQDIVERFA